MSPLEVLNKWFAAHEGGDTAMARSLMMEGALVSVPGQRLQGFDALMEWYRQRRAAELTFSYRVVDVLAGEANAAAVLMLRRGSEQWRQLVLYEIKDGRICSVWAVEEK